MFNYSTETLISIIPSYAISFLTKEDHSGRKQNIFIQYFLPFSITHRPVQNYTFANKNKICKIIRNNIFAIIHICIFMKYIFSTFFFVNIHTI